MTTTTSISGWLTAAFTDPVGFSRSAYRARSQFTQQTRPDATGVASIAALNRQSSLSEIQRNAPADGRTVPLVYGRAQVGGKPFTVSYADGLWTVGYVVALGEIDGFESVLINGEPPLPGVTINYYVGTPTQAPDPLLAAAVDGYADDLVIRKETGNLGVAYVVLQYAADVYIDWPQVLVTFRGRKILNPITGLVEYSENPALWLSDLLSSTRYGDGYDVNTASLQAALDYCDDTTLGEVRRTGYLVIDQPRPTSEWIEVARTLAGCYVAIRGNTAFLVPDRPGASVAHFTDETIIGDPDIRKKDSSALPTVVRVAYTDTTEAEWRERSSEPAMLPGVATGAVERRESRVRITGVNRHSQAYREAVERLNKLQLSDLTVSFVTTDWGLYLEVGDIITVSHAYGLTDKLLRVNGPPEQVEPGRWRVQAVEYDPAAYSDEIATQPTYADGNLPSDQAPPPVSDLTLTETTYQGKNGEYLSRINIAWAPSTSIFVTGYTVEVTDSAGAVVHSANTSGRRLATPPLKELEVYTVSVIAYTPILAGEAALAQYSIVGKTAIPDPPEELRGFEAGGEVRLNWPPSTDVDAKRYEIRYGDTTGSWETATVLDVVDSLRLVSKEIPPSENQTGGVWRFYVKTIDSVFQISDTAAVLDIPVTQDNDAFTAGAISPIESALATTAMHETVESRIDGKTQFYSDSGETWADLFGGAPLSDFGNALASYQNPPGESLWESEELALFTDRGGSWLGALPEVVDLSGAAAKELGLRPDGGSYAWAELTRRGSARYARVRARSTGVFRLCLPGGSIRADVIAEEETGQDTSLASGPRTVTLNNPYIEVRSIVITPQGTSARIAVYDNIVVGGTASFDVYIFDASGAQVANAFQWSFKGV